MINLNKKGQALDYPIATFIIVFIGLLLMAPIMLKITGDILEPVGASLGNLTGDAGTSIGNINQSFINFWDFIIVIAFIVTVLLLFMSAFFIDTHPLFIVIYIILSMIMVMFSSEFVRIIDSIYDSATFLGEVNNLGLVNFLRGHFEFIILIIIILSGVVIYGKLKYFRGGQY
jgi:hypothetical protein